jgi:hypothetical protein
MWSQDLENKKAVAFINQSGVKKSEKKVLKVKEKTTQ